MVTWPRPLLPVVRLRRRLGTTAVTVVAIASLSCQAHHAAPSRKATAAALPPPSIVLPVARLKDARTGSLRSLVAPEIATTPRAAVRHLFEAIEQESSEKLSQILAAGAVLHRPHKDPSSVLVVWVRRFAAHDYAGSNAAALATDSNVQLVDQDSFHALQPIRDLRLEPGRDEVLAVVALPHVPADKLWGTQLQIILNQHSGNWRIRALWEDYSQF